MDSLYSGWNVRVRRVQASLVLLSNWQWPVLMHGVHTFPAQGALFSISPKHGDTQLGKALACPVLVVLAPAFASHFKDQCAALLTQVPGLRAYEGFGRWSDLDASQEP